MTTDDKYKKLILKKIREDKETREKIQNWLDNLSEGRKSFISIPALLGSDYNFIKKQGEKLLSVDDFISRILEGERDFEGITLSNESDLTGNDGYLDRTLLNYLKEQDFEKNPVNLKKAHFNKVKARGLYLPYVDAREAIFTNCQLKYSNFFGGKFYKTNFSGSNLKFCDLRDAKLVENNFYRSHLWKAKVSDYSIINPISTKSSKGIRERYLKIDENR